MNIRKEIDFSNTGGFPLTQDTLEYMQEGYREVLLALATYGIDATTISTNIPVVLTGMSIVGNIYKAGWLYYNGAVICFPNDINITGLPALGGGGVYGWVVTETDTPLTFNDASTPNVMKLQQATIAAGTTLGSTFIPLSTTLHYPQEYFLLRGKEATETHLSVSAGGISGDVYYRKNIMNNTLHIRGNLAITTSVSATPTYYNLGTLAAAYRPASQAIPFKALFRYHLSTLKEQSGVDYIRDLNMELDTAGLLNVGALQPASGSYGVSFNCILPLD